jgi:hypothetical protein
MPIFSDSELISKLIEGTQESRVDWQKTAMEDQYAVSVGGKWTVVIDKAPKSESFWLDLKNSEGEDILTIYDSDDSRIGLLFHLAKRHALKVNDAIADLIKELEK